MKHIILAIDSFKGCLSSAELGKAAAEGVRAVFPACQTTILPVADGGEGTVDALTQATGGEIVKATVHGPLGQPVEARYGIAADRRTAILEMASASGLALIPYNIGNVMEASTYGTGELIADAIRRGCRRILMGIGGSATNDAGVGMLQALGFRFLGAAGENIRPCGGNLERIRSYDAIHVHPELASCHFRVAVDVDNPFYGTEGAAYVFAPQKGATPEMVRQLDRGLQHFSALVLQEKGIDLQQIPGSGAAGGLGGACHAFLGAELLPGIEMVLRELDFDRLLADADLVITGEGKIDRQTLRGKVVAGVARHARERGIPVIALTGNATDLSPALYDMGMTACFPIHPAPVSLEKAMEAEYARENVRKVVEEMMRVVKATKYFKTERINPKIIKTA